MATPERLVKEPLPNVLAIAGTFAYAFQKPSLLGDQSFLDIHSDCLKGRAPVVWTNVCEGARRAGDPESCPRLRAPAEISFIFNGLII